MRFMSNLIFLEMEIMIEVDANKGVVKKVKKSK